MYILLIYILILISIDILSYLTLSRGRIIKSPALSTYLKIIHLLLSIFSWVLIIVLIIRRNDFTENRYLSLMMFFAVVFITIWVPRIITVLFSNLSFWLRKRTPVFSKVLNYSGKIISSFIIIALLLGTFIGRFNFKYEEVDISYNILPPDLEGFRIVHLSDMHLSSFHNKEDRLEKVMENISKLSPDLIVNTGDFVTISWKEMAPFTSILNKSESRYGNFAIPGNHDAGTYHPYYNEEDKANNVSRMDSLMIESGYIQLKDSSLILNIGVTSLKIAGVTTKGTIPDIIFGDLDKALGSEKADFTLLLSHDPNHWYYEIEGNDGIDLTLSGHTHGGQFGMSIGKFKWSPASPLYPAWNGLYEKNDTYLYVNRGLGTISLPARIGMPPEITVITLKSKN